MVGQKVVFTCLVSFAVCVSTVRGVCEVIETQNFDITKCTPDLKEVDKVDGLCPMEMAMREAICKSVEIEYCHSLPNGDDPICHTITRDRCVTSHKVDIRYFPTRDDDDTCLAMVADCEQETVPKSKKEKCNF